MRKTTKFLFGLLVGSSVAYLMLKEMSPLKKRQLMDKVNKNMHSLKKNTVDYAFYANDTLGNTSKDVKKHAKSIADSIGNHAKDLKGRFGDHLTQFNHIPKHVHFQNAANHLHSALQKSSNDHDIVLSPDEAFQDSNNVVIYYPDGTLRNC